MIRSLNIGDTRAYKRILTSDDVKKFAEVSGDYNPAHLDDAYAETTIFKKPIAHGMLVGSLFSKIFGTEFPGEGTIYVSQSLTFLKPVYPDTELTIRVTIKEVLVEKNRVYFTTEIFDQANNLLLTGEAMLMPKKVKGNV